MTNREYFKQKKKAFYNKLGDWFNKHLGDWFDKHLNFIYLFCLVLDVLLFITVLKIDCLFLPLFIPWTLFCFGFSWAMVELWLDKEHKESE